MNRTLHFLLIVMGLVILPHLTIAAEAPVPVLWDIKSKGWFDETNKAYPLAEGVATVDLELAQAKCPTGLGNLVSGRTVQAIIFRFNTPKAGDYWLHIKWSPGGSGQEQFSILVNGQNQAQSSVIDGTEHPEEFFPERYQLKLAAGSNTITLKYLSGDGLHFKNVVLATSPDLPPPLNPELKYPTLASYEAAIKAPGVIQDGVYIRLYAPRRRAAEAKLIFDYLVKAYAELNRIVGLPTEYKIVVYHFPKNHPDAQGGTSNCTIWYSDENLNFQAFDEWKRYHMPHLSGYIEEMAHNFVAASHAQFGWEMIGWSLGAMVTEKVAGNPLHRQQVASTRKGQEETCRRYRQAGGVFPADLEANQCDRIHAYLLWLCEQRYGTGFWPDFFTEIRQAQSAFRGAEKISGDAARNRRYQITLDCFDKLKGLDFKHTLRSWQISLNVDVKSLHPTDPGWNRRLLPVQEAITNP